MSPATLRRSRNGLLVGAYMVLAGTWVQAHEHHAPHGGTLVEVGEDFAHVELLPDLQQGNLTVYILDGEAENPIRIHQPSMDLIIDEASYAGMRKASFMLHLKAVA